MNEELVLVSGIADPSSCAVIKADDSPRVQWACARFNACHSTLGGCTAGTKNVWIKQSDMTRYLALKLVS